MILWLSTIFALILVFVAYVKMKNHRTASLLKKIPGPKPNIVFGNLVPLLWASYEDWIDIIVKMVQPYKKEPICIFWVGHKPYVLIFHLPVLEGILNSNQDIDKSEAYRYLHPWLGTGLLTSTGDKWRTRRKLITPAFHFRILEDFFVTFVDHTHTLLTVLDKLDGKGFFDIYPYLKRCTLDMICETAMGKQINVQSDDNSEYAGAVHKLGRIMSFRLMLPILQNDFLFSLSPYGKSQKSLLKTLHNFTNQVIKERYAEYQERKNKNAHETSNAEDIGQKRRLAFLDMLLEHLGNTPYLMNLEDIREEVDTFMFEGHDTTSTGLAWIFFNVGRFPDIQRKLHDELDQVFGKSDRQMQKEDLAELKYLELVIKESLRLFPPVAVVFRKLTRDLELGGYTVPAGVDVSIPIYLLNKDENQFPDPEKFDPDRFRAENCLSRHPFSYIPFSAGPRNCIGQKFAMMELKTVVSQVLRRYTITAKHRIDEIKLIDEMVMRPAQGMWIKLENRKMP